MNKNSESSMKYFWSISYNKRLKLYLFVTLIAFYLLDVYRLSKSSMNPSRNEMFHQFIFKEYVNTNSAILLFALKFLVISLIKLSCIYYRQDPKTLSFLKMFIWQFLLFLLSVLHVHVWTIISLKCLSSDSFHVSLLFHSIMYLALHDNSW